MARKPSIPQRYSSLMSKSRQEDLQQKQRDFSEISMLSRISTASSTVFDFLEEKIKSYQLEVDYIKTYRDGLHEAKLSNKISDNQYKMELNAILDDFRSAQEDLQLVKRQRFILEDDLEDEIHAHKRQGDNDIVPDHSFLERAYTDVIVPRVMGSIAKQRKSKFNQSAFRKDVLKYYSAIKGDSKETLAAYCHLTGWTDGALIKAAHLVPKSLTGEEISYFFGIGELVHSDPRNGISLHKNIEAGLDNGSIAIIPIPEDGSAQGTRWKCVLVDDSLRKKDCLYREGSMIKWDSLDGMELMFLTSNRPSRRFLYFRFIITYIHAKKLGNRSFTEKVEGKSHFWASPGPYLRQSTLISLAGNISGCELPPSLLDDTTFKDSGSMRADEEDDINTLLSVQLRDAIIQSSKQKEAEDEDEDEEAAEDSDESEV